MFRVEVRNRIYEYCLTDVSLKTALGLGHACCTTCIEYLPMCFYEVTNVM
jgi:hypothetical protein